MKRFFVVLDFSLLNAAAAPEPARLPGARSRPGSDADAATRFPRFPSPFRRRGAPCHPAAAPTDRAPRMLRVLMALLLSQAGLGVRRMGVRMSTSGSLSSALLSRRDAQAFSWQQTMLRVSDADAAKSFYGDKLGMTLMHEYAFDDFSLYFYASLPEGEAAQAAAEAGSAAGERRLWTYGGTTLELTHNHDSDEVYHHGNSDPRGFGHVAFSVPDVASGAARLEEQQVRFIKRPDEGRMKDIAFAADPDGYYVEILKGGDPSRDYTFSQTMFRIADPKASLRFYCDLLGMTLLAQKTFDDFSLYFLKTLSPEERARRPADLDPESDEAYAFLADLKQPVLELTHNHDSAEVYHSGNTDPRGFGHIGFLCNDLEETCAFLDEAGCYGWQKRAEEGRMSKIAFALDPDGYWVELVPRDATFPGGLTK